MPACLGFDGLCTGHGAFLACKTPALTLGLALTRLGPDLQSYEAPALYVIPTWIRINICHLPRWSTRTIFI
jgi:hypothetical protein